MSRSYKKTYGWTDQQGSKVSRWCKRLASKRVRRSKVVANGGYHKKLFCSWDICDYKILFYSAQELAEWHGEGKGKSYKYMRK